MRSTTEKYLLHFFGVILTMQIYPTAVLGIQGSHLSPKIQNYFEVLKEELKNKEFGDIKMRNEGEKFPLFSSPDRVPKVMPDGYTPEIAIGPGKPPKQLHLANKRGDGQHQEYDVTCKGDEWFVFADDMPVCVNPVWDGGYDPVFCAKMKSGWVYCGCDDNQLPGMKEGMDTCIDKEDVMHGWCHLDPCPPTFTCAENVENRRYDCIKGNLKVPSWY